MVHIAGALLSSSAEIIRERVKAGLANAKRRDRKVGRPRAHVDVQEVLQDASQGLSGREIAKVAGIFRGDGEEDPTVGSRALLNAGRRCPYRWSL
jgi:DNA invertase Pin-like site-specific DNA recombinase